MNKLVFSPSVPIYTGGKHASAYYNCGGMIADDSRETTAEDLDQLYAVIKEEILPRAR
jgi:hypothetical protein